MTFDQNCNNAEIQSNLSSPTRSIRHNEDYLTMNVQNIIGLDLSQNFGHTLYDIVEEFLDGKCIFELSHMIGLTISGDDLFKQVGNL